MAELPNIEVNVAHERRKEVAIGRLFHNIISNYIGKLVTLAAWFFLTPFMLEKLGATVYGLWVLVGSIATYGWLFDFGIAGALTKYIAEYRVKAEADHSQALIATAFYLYCAIGLLVVTLGALIAPIFPHLFKIAPHQQTLASQLVLLSGLEVGLSIPCSTTQAILRGLQRFDLTNLIAIVGSLLFVTATVCVLLLGGEITDVVILGIAIMLIMQVPSVWFIHRVAPDLRFGWRAATREQARTLASFSSWLFVLRVGGYLETKADEIVIGAFLPMNSVTFYNIARKLSTLPQILTEQFVRVLLPLASELHAEKDLASLRSLYIVSTRLTLAIFLPIGCALILMARPILTAWVGVQYSEYAHLVVILTIASFIDSSQWPAGFILQGMARHRLPALLSFYTGLANLGLSIILVNFFGLTGVALGTLIPTSIVCLGFVFPYAMRSIGVKTSQAVKEIFLPAILPAVPMMIFLYTLEHVSEPTSLLSVVVLIVIGLLVYAIGYLNLGASEFERQTFRNFAIDAIRFAEIRLKRS